MLRQPLDIVIAKDQLIRINDSLSEPLVLIGGLAVNQYHPSRSSFDIDLVCTYEQSRSIAENLFPSETWSPIESNEDEYRPEFIFTHKVHYYIVKFGPKIIEREPYDHIIWSDIAINARPFQYRQNKLDRILHAYPVASHYVSSGGAELVG